MIPAKIAHKQCKKSGSARSKVALTPNQTTDPPSHYIATPAERYSQVKVGDRVIETKNVAIGPLLGARR